MAWIRWAFLLCASAFWCPTLDASEKANVRRVTYMLQPGASHSRRLSGRQQRLFNLELVDTPYGNSRRSSSSSSSTLERTRRMSKPSNPGVQLRLGPTVRLQHKPAGIHTAASSSSSSSSSFAKAGKIVLRSKTQQRHSNGTSGAKIHPKAHLRQLQGVNVCGRQCCHGWSKVPGSQRCTKPNCSPPCQHGGMCLRPQLCVCKPGTKGSVCEDATKQETVSPGGSSPATPPWPIPQRSVQQMFSKKVQVQQKSNPMAQMTFTLKQKPSGLPQQAQPQIIPLSSQSLMMNVHHGQTHEYVIKPKYYPSKKVLSGEQSTESSLPLRMSQDHLATSYQMGNHTGRIKVVFTPSICKVTCKKGTCQNSCEKGNTTTLISENGHAADTLTAPNFRVVICHLPCMNGGQCSSRDKCQCPPNYTGKLCQIPVQSGSTSQLYHNSQQVSKTAGSHVIHSTHTLPLTVPGQQGSKVKIPPNFVNIHVKHPPEASVQFHQVSRIDSTSAGQKPKPKPPTSGHSQSPYQSLPFQKTQKIHSTYIHQQPITHTFPVSAKTQLGRCFQETVGTQCSKALPGLSKQEDCCGTVGTSWGFNKCQKCPKKPAYFGYSQVVDCPQGYKRINATFCQDINECQLQGVCPNGECLNTMGSYRCTCKLGFVPDPTLSRCILVEKTSPPLPVEVGPDVSTSSASQVIAPTQVTEINECTVNPDICGQGHCINLPVGYTCLCYDGYRLNDQQTKCSDINECSQTPQLCSRGHCENTEGSFLCICQAGFMANEQGTDCVDVDECARPDTCGEGLCVNTIGSYKCEYCDRGFQRNRRGQCEDIDECSVPHICPDAECINAPGSYQCVPCRDGFRAWNGKCHDVNECQYSSLCTNGQCENLEGSFRCLCSQGYQLSPAGDQCEDVDECQQQLCINGQCRNVAGSYRCLCEQGYQLSSARDYCEDINECQEDKNVCHGGTCINTKGSYECTCPDGFQLMPSRGCQDINECAESNLCSSHGKCLNTEGSFRCICEQGFMVSRDGRTCEDIDDCANSTICGGHGFCENSPGSYRCLCYQGYQYLQDGQGCVDVNECEMLSGVCGEALCENVEGSFLCLCSNENQEYDPMSGLCQFRSSTEFPDRITETVEKKECYYNLNDANFCDNVLTSNVTKQECCCTLGAGWGDNCEIFPCPVLGSAEFIELCPEGKGFIPSEEARYGDIAHNYKDADECQLFGQEICKNGFCLNTQPGYECYCKQGTYYDPIKLQCFDTDECQDINSCIDGQCINTEGSYSCFCTHPMVLDSTGKQCIRPAESSEQTEESDVYQDLCWQHLNEDFVCSQPLVGKQTTYTECCCLYGDAWGMQCALCPMKNSEDYAQLCNIPVPGSRPYGQDALVDFEQEHYTSETDPYFMEDRFLNSFEELQAEECGILNGCENGRCVRVQEGYTCDCFDGYHLDMTKMTCVDVNECNELNNRMSLCKNAKCINTEGSYKCVCLPGFISSNRPNYCTPLNSDPESDLE